MTIPTAAELQRQALRDGIAHLAKFLTDTQRVKLYQIHDNAPWHGIENIPDVHLADTYDLIRRTLT